MTVNTKIYFWALYSVPLVYMFFNASSMVFDYYSFMLYLKIRDSMMLSALFVLHNFHDTAKMVLKEKLTVTNFYLTKKKALQ
jgi:hypothetical protein